MKAETTAMVESFRQAFSESPQGRNTPPAEIEFRAKELHPGKYSKALRETTSKDDEWWDKANLFKQQGFYVNFQGSKWIGPLTTTNESENVYGLQYQRVSKRVSADPGPPNAGERHERGPGRF